MKVKLHDVSKMPVTAYYYIGLLNVIYNYIDRLGETNYNHLKKISQVTSFYDSKDQKWEDEKEELIDIIDEITNVMPKNWHERLDAIVHCAYLCVQDFEDYQKKVNFNHHASNINKEIQSYKGFNKLKNFRKMEIKRKAKADIEKKVNQEFELYLKLIKTNTKPSYYSQMMFEKICTLDRISI